MTFPVIIWCILASSCVLGPLTAALMSVPLSGYLCVSRQHTTLVLSFLNVMSLSFSWVA